MKDIFCHCKHCRKAKKKGLILGSKRRGMFKGYPTGAFDAYVRYHRYAKGRRPNDVAFAFVGYD